MLKLPKMINTTIRYCSNVASKTILEPLKTRSLIRVNGNEAKDFLQGLITNDINHLSQSTGGSMYTMFLNTKGRVLYDAVVYKIENENNYFIECSSEIDKQLERHLKAYRVRKKIDICNLSNEYQVHVLFRSSHIKQGKEKSDDIKDKLERDKPQVTTPLKLFSNILVFKDPRVADLGCRVISKSEVDVQKELSSLDISLPKPSENYKLLRYSLGIGEGINDLPVGNCFPLESNCDYLHGVSFHKGCYIGQELTARTHHTGVVRKRLMPLFFTKAPSTLPSDNVIKSDKTSLGKLRGVEANLGLALLRVESALELGEFQVGDEVAQIWKPHWWPLELPKEKLQVQKT